MDQLRTLFTYNRWANLRLLDVIEDLTPEELGKDLGSSFPSVAATLVHVIGAEWVWLRRWQGESPTSFPDAMTLNSVAEVRARWDALWEEQRAYLDGLGDQGLDRTVTYRTFDGSAYNSRWSSWWATW